MSTLNLDANLYNSDDFYAQLLAAHEGLSKTESDALNARLIFVLANHIGKKNILELALATCKKPPKTRV